jgi:phosphatidylglycerol---prolipoprotein diacylglyceryl transferase
MFIHNIDPVFFSIGSLEIRYYGLVYSLGFILVYFLLRYYSNKKIIKLSNDQIDILLVYLMVGLILGARLFEILFWEPQYYFSDIKRILYIHQGGLSFHGGLFGIIVSGYLFCKKYKFNFFEIADIVVIPAALMLAFGRIANFINGELPGRITNVSWCVQFPYYEGCRHPSQLYGSLKRFIIFFWLLVLNKKQWKSGFLFWNFILLDGLGRFIVDFFRDNTLHFGLTMGQILSLFTISISAYYLYKNHKEDLKKLFQ